MDFALTSVENFFLEGEPDFTFVFNGVEFPCNRFHAAFLSPRISQIMKADALFSRFEITLPQYTPEQFTKIMDLLKNPVDFVGDDAFLCDISRILENSEIYMLTEIYKKAPIHSNAIEGLKNRFFHNTPDFTKWRDFVAAHLCEFDRDAVMSLSPEILYDVLTSNDVKVLSEEWLWNLVMELSARDKAYEACIRQIKFQNLAEKELKKYIDKLDLSSMSGEFWSNICTYITQKDVKSPQDRYTSELILHKYDGTEEGMLHGILHSFIVSGGSENDVPNITVTGGPTLDDENPEYSAKNAARVDKNSYFLSDDSSTDHTICYDFGEMKFIPTAYAIRSRPDEPVNGKHLRSWVIEVSMDGTEWTEVDKQENNSELNGSGITKVFNLDDHVQSKLIRLRQTGEGWCEASPNSIAVCCFEIFGKIQARQLKRFAWVPGSNPFNGIMAELRRRCGGQNPSTAGMIEVKASSIHLNEPHNVLDYDWNRFFGTNDVPNSWIEFDMKNMSVSVTNYSLRSGIPFSGTFPDTFTQWAIEGSNNERVWELIDSRNTHDLAEPRMTATYEVQHKGKFYRYIRMHHTGENLRQGHHFLEISNIELFGTISFGPDSPQPSAAAPASRPPEQAGPPRFTLPSAALRSNFPRPSPFGARPSSPWN